MSKKKFWEIKNKATDEKAELLLYGEISDATWWGDEVTPKQFADDLSTCNSKDLVVRINSPGGDVFAAQAIYNLLKSYAGDVTVHIDGICASAATVVACAGNKVIMPDNALYMIHNPHAVLIDAYDAVGLSKLESELHAVKKTITNVYQKKCGDAMSAEDISRAMDEETWMGADEALTFGFIDEIDNNFAIKTNMKSDTLIVNSVVLPTKGRNMDKITSIIDKKKGENMKDNEMISKIKAVLGIKESEDPKVAAERQRIAALDALRTEDKNPYVEAIIDTCKKTEGVEVKTVKPIIDSILAVKVENKPDEKIEAIMKIIQDNVDSGANGVKPTPQHNPEDNELQKLEADISDIVNRANKIRGNK